MYSVETWHASLKKESMDPLGNAALAMAISTPRRLDSLYRTSPTSGGHRKQTKPSFGLVNPALKLLFGYSGSGKGDKPVVFSWPGQFG